MKLATKTPPPSPPPPLAPGGGPPPPSGGGGGGVGGGGGGGLGVGWRLVFPRGHRPSSNDTAQSCEAGKERTMIEFETPSTITKQMTMLGAVAEEMMRPVSRHFDDHQHEIPWNYINFMHEAMTATGAGMMGPGGGRKRDGPP